MSRVFSWVMLGVSIVAMGAAMVLGTSAAVPYFGPTWPFLTFGGTPSSGTVTTLTWIAAVTAGAGVLAGLYALRGGAWVSPRRLLIAGAVVACVYAMLPPAGSVDMMNYAIYGRIADLGRDPYVTTPLRLAHTGDPVGLLMPSGWQRVPTVYGPIMTFIQWLAAHFGGNSMARIIFLLKWANAAAFVGTGVILHRMTGPDPVRRLRACLLWTANPLILFWMVGSGHADAFAVFFLVAALYAARRSAFAGGVLGGAAVAVKASFLFPAVGLVVAAWLSPARFRRAAASAVGLLLVAGGGYLLAGPAALNSLNARLGRKKDRYLPVPEYILTHHGLYTLWMGALAVALTAFLWWRSGLPFALWRRPSDETRRLPLDVLPVAVLAFGTTLVSPLQYPWYDAMLLPILALLSYRRLDWMLILRGVMLGVFTLPGVRVNGYQHFYVRWANLVWLIVFIVVVWWGTRRTGAEPSAESPALTSPSSVSPPSSSPAPA
ncbi:hypothetical protein [Actinoallomurus rhizosphaericola]|uniref:hypothetical protein n=1 Tax=Actinoallomurus rhizosphaericola TaxID=2952536 RepID=UPI002092E60E|nr:hypothetical protein [Actinoallomurus rhizosphaericola]MCO5999163.1 hypothetical protein [Actinoallomurus rhizosphaericola]